MGLVTKAYEFVADATPTAAQWNANPDAILAAINGNLDAANVDEVSADGIMTLNSAQTITGVKTFSAAPVMSAGLDLNGTTLYLDADADTYLDASTDDTLYTYVGGSAVALLNAGGFSLDATNATLQAHTGDDTAAALRLIADRNADNNSLGDITGLWGKSGSDLTVGRISFLAGDDTSNYDNGQIAFYTATSGGTLAERMRINETGNVGIGATASARLEVEDGGLASATVPLLKLTADDATPYALVIGNDTFSTDDRDGLQLWVGDAGTVNMRAYQQSATTYVTLDIDAKQFALTAQDATDTALTLAKPNATNAYLYLQASGSSGGTSVGVRANGDDLGLIAGGTLAGTVAHNGTDGSIVLAGSAGATLNADQIGLNLGSADLGTSHGRSIDVRHNSNGSTPAAGSIGLWNRAGTRYYLWVDATGDLRIGTSAPTNANDTSGTVVGTQS